MTNPLEYQGEHRDVWHAADHREPPVIQDKPRPLMTRRYIDSRHRVSGSLRSLLSSYDATGQNQALVNPQGDRTTFSFDAAGRETLVDLANGTRASSTYDVANRLTQRYELKSDSTVIASFDYEYDDVGNKTRVIEAGGDRVTWSYDVTNQLTREQRSGTTAYDRKSTFDALGNRLTWDVDGAVTTSTYDSANELLTSEDASGVTTYTYDAAGNQRVVETPAGTRTTSVWDDENRRVQVLLPTGGRVTNTYRNDGLRYSKEDSSGTTKFIWDEDRYLMETNGSDETQVVYTSPPVPFGRQVSQYRKEGALWVPSYYHSDALGSTRALTDASEVITDTYLYDAWGEDIAQTGTTDNPFQWVGAVGYYRDPETGTYYLRARVYQPGIGRWLSRDPLGYMDSTHLYLYVQNDPVSNVDPEGLQILPPPQETEIPGPDFPPIVEPPFGRGRRGPRTIPWPNPPYYPPRSGPCERNYQWELQKICGVNWKSCVDRCNSWRYPVIPLYFVCGIGYRPVSVHWPSKEQCIANKCDPELARCERAAFRNYLRCLMQGMPSPMFPYFPPPVFP